MKPLLKIAFTDEAAIAFCQAEITALVNKLGQFKSASAPAPQADEDWAADNMPVEQGGPGPSGAPFPAPQANDGKPANVPPGSDWINDGRPHNPAKPTLVADKEER